MGTGDLADIIFIVVDFVQSLTLISYLECSPVLEATTAWRFYQHVLATLIIETCYGK